MRSIKKLLQYLYAHNPKYGSAFLRLDAESRSRLAECSKAELDWFVRQWDRRGLHNALRLLSQMNYHKPLGDPAFYFAPHHTDTAVRDSVMQWLLYNDKVFTVPWLSKHLSVHSNGCARWARKLAEDGYMFREKSGKNGAITYRKTKHFETAFGGYREQIAG